MTRTRRTGLVDHSNLRFVNRLPFLVQDAEQGALPLLYAATQDVRSSEIAAFPAYLVPGVLADSEDLATDPVVAAAWEYGTATSPARLGEPISITLFAVYPAAYEQPSAVLELNHWRALVEAQRATISRMVRRRARLSAADRRGCAA